jgi:hypothetical protein
MTRILREAAASRNACVVAHPLVLYDTSMCPAEGSARACKESWALEVMGRRELGGGRKGEEGGGIDVDGLELECTVVHLV